MSDMKPMRHEDYMAMAEENRRLKAEAEKAKDANRKVHSKRMNKAVVMFVVGVILFVGTVVLLTEWDFSAKQRRMAAKRHTECFFVQQGHYGDSEMPWDPWYLWRSPCEDCGHNAVSKDGKLISYSTQIEAWNFAQHWKLPMCK